MAYQRTIYVNDSTPPISAENLNKSENELERLSLIGDETPARLNSKVDKEKTYSTINGNNNQGYLWNKRTKRADSFSSYSYSIYSSGFTVGEFIAATGYQSSNRTDYPIVIAYDSSMNVLFSYANDSSTGTVARYEFVVPVNTAYIYINGQKTGNGVPKLEAINYSSKNLTDVENEISAMSFDIYENSKKTDGKIDKTRLYSAISGTNHTTSLWNVVNKSADTFNNYSYSVFSSGFNEGDYVYASGYQSANMTVYPVIMLYDSNMNLIKSYAKPSSTGFYEKEFAIPTGCAYIYVNGWISGSDYPSLNSVTFEDADISEIQSKLNYLDDSKIEKIKSYSSISGGTEYNGLWAYATKSGTYFDGYKYKVFSSGFTPGGYIAIDGYQPSSYTSYILCCFYDSTMRILGTVTEARSGNFNKVFALVPLGTAYIYVNGKTTAPQPSIYNINYEEVDISLMEYELKNWKERRYSDGEYINYTRKTPDHAVIAFCLDDSRSDVSDASDLFITKEVPLCLATVPSRLNEVCDNGDTVLETCQKTVENGGEILCHSMAVIDADSTPEEYYTYFVENKKILEEAGLKVDGIVKAGGGSDDPNIKTVKTYLRSFYDYGTGFQYINDNRYNINRLSMEYSLDTLKSRIDDIANGGILFFYGHGANDLGEEWIDKISDLIDYIGTVENAEIVTIGEALTENLVASFNQ